MKTISFRLPEEVADFIDSHVDGIYIRDRSHYLRIIIDRYEEEYNRRTNK